MSRLSLEPIDRLKPFHCPCCGREAQSGQGYVFEDERPLAIYFATLHDAENKNGVALAIGIGEWSDDGSRQCCTAMGIDVGSTDSEFRMRVVEPEESPWAKTKVLGPLLSREQALIHPLKTKIFEIADHIVTNDGTIAAHLGH